MRSGNTAARWKHRQASATLTRRVAAILPSIEADLGNRSGLEEAFGFGDPRSFEGSPERFRWLASRWLAR